MTNEATLTSPITAWPASEAAWKRTSASLAGGVSTGLRASMRPHPIFFERGSGARLTDLDGNVYLDYVLGWGPVILAPRPSRAHRGRRRTAAPRRYLRSRSPARAEAAEAVLDRIPGTERVLWSNTGSEANQTALRLARAFTGRRRFVKFRGHYHGWTDSFLVGYRPAADGTLGLWKQGQNPGALDDAQLVDWGDLKALEIALTDPSKRHRGGVPGADPRELRCHRPAGGLYRGGTGTLRSNRRSTRFRRGDPELPHSHVAARWNGTASCQISSSSPRPSPAATLAAIAGKAAIVDQVTAGVVHAGTYSGNPVVLGAAVARPWRRWASRASTRTSSGVERRSLRASPPPSRRTASRPPCTRSARSPRSSRRSRARTPSTPSCAPTRDCTTASAWKCSAEGNSSSPEVAGTSRPRTPMMTSRRPSRRPVTPIAAIA